jgi:hypothetical protein
MKHSGNPSKDTRKNGTARTWVVSSFSQTVSARIRDNPLRPEVCRLYPFSFRDGDERCPAFRGHRRIVTALTREEGAFELYDSSFCPEDAPRPIPDQIRPAILHRFLDADPPPEVTLPFIAVNHKPLPADGKRGATPKKIRVSGRVSGRQNPGDRGFPGFAESVRFPFRRPA